MNDPFRIEPPALISFSGGRTSAYMLWRILQAHGGELPEGVFVTFANTGKEREETLRFVHECGSRWNVPITWLEWRARSGPIEDRFEIVGFNSAARNGEPFERLIDDKSYLPNGVMRFCTIELKIRIMGLFMETQGFENWRNVVGLRADEPKRVQRAAQPNRDRWMTIMPLAEAGITQRDVLAFWREQDFDLGLKGFEGNCDGCFLKGRAKLIETEATSPGTLEWWSRIEQKIAARVAAKHGPFRRRKVIDRAEDGSPIFSEWEVHWPSGGQFSKRFSYAELIEVAQRQPDLFRGAFDGDPDHDSECGTWCG